jgi:murein DD-endopeptidase MepM/ murein hydrolase activator NlpD
VQQQVQAMRAEVAVIKQQVQARYQFTAREVRRLGLDPKRVAYTGKGGPYEAISRPRRRRPQFQGSVHQLEEPRPARAGHRLHPLAEAGRKRFLHQRLRNPQRSFPGPRSDARRDRPGRTRWNRIYATAAGIVGRSEWAGGYGNLVEIDHGKGIQTRYGHLSSSLVRAGQRVKRGDLIARMGSTGRSTGSHLHYEVRIDGKPVNPVPFMQSNDYLQSVQARAAIASGVAVGGPSGASK